MITRSGSRLGGAALLLVVVAAAACSGSTANPGNRMSVVTTSTIFGDMVQRVGGDLVAVTSLVPRHADVHTFEPKADDLRALSGARVVIMNGLRLDDWLRETIEEGAKPDTKVVALAEHLEGVDLLPGEEPGEENPHLWLSVPYAIKYVDRIEAALAAADPGNAAAYDRQATAYREELSELDAEIRSRIAEIPETARRIVTFHDALPYFAREYGIEIVGVAVEAPGQEPSAAKIAELVDAIRSAEVKAIFSEDQFPTHLIDRIAAETGARVVSNLYTDSLGDPPLDTYVAIMRWDVDEVVAALTGPGS